MLVLAPPTAPAAPASRASAPSWPARPCWPNARPGWRRHLRRGLDADRGRKTVPTGSKRAGASRDGHGATDPGIRLHPAGRGGDHRPRAVLQIGDGAIVVGTPDEGYRPVFWPQGGEYANETYFVTDAGAAAHLECAILTEPIVEIALLTDGLQRLALHYQTRQPTNRFSVPCSSAREHPEPGCPTVLVTALERLLASPAINQRTHDDKTLILATRLAATRSVEGAIDTGIDLSSSRRLQRHGRTSQRPRKNALPTAGEDGAKQHPPNPRSGTNPVTRLYSGAGHLVEPGKALGRGGEGAVHDIVGRPGFVAKITIRRSVPTRRSNWKGWPGKPIPACWKLPPGRWTYCAPSRPVRSVASSCPRSAAIRKSTACTVPRTASGPSRKTDWSFLIHAARNLASAFETIHARGHVIGDVNPGNVVISAQALVKLIDCDSSRSTPAIGYSLATSAYRSSPRRNCRTGRFTGCGAPGPRRLRSGLCCVFTCCSWDAALRRPLSGQGDMPIERAIRECRFAFGHHAAARSMESPPHALPFAALPHPVAHLFERAFAPPTPAQRRPSAREWLLALEQLGGELRTCRHSALHKYPQRSPACPMVYAGADQRNPVFRATGPSIGGWRLWRRPRRR